MLENLEKLRLQENNTFICEIWPQKITKHLFKDTPFKITFW